MLGLVFGGLVRKLEGAATNVSHSAIAAAGEEVDKFFGEKLYPLAGEFDYMVQRRLEQVGELSEKTAGNISELKDEFKDDIEGLLSEVDEKYRDDLRLTFERIDESRIQAIADLRATLGEIDSSLEHQIDQISRVLIEVLKGARKLGDRLTPEAFTKELVDPALKNLEALEEKILIDAEKIIDRIDEVVTKTNEELKNNFLKRLLAHALPNPFDECRRRLKIAGKIGPSLSDIELYELTECHELSKLNENTPIDEILKTYEELQLNAAKMAAIAKQVPSRKRRAVRDWIKYGVLCEFWRDAIKTYDPAEPLLLEPQIAQNLLTERENG